MRVVFAVYSRVRVCGWGEAVIFLPAPGVRESARHRSSF